MQALLDATPMADDLLAIVAALEALAPAFGESPEGCDPAVLRLGSALVMAFLADGGSPLAYAALARLRPEAAEAVAVAVSKTDFVSGAADPAAVSKAVILTIATATAAAGGREPADELLRQAMFLRPDCAAFVQAHTWVWAR